MHSRWNAIDGTLVHVRTWGDGVRAAILFVHGLRSWLPTASFRLRTGLRLGLTCMHVICQASAAAQRVKRSRSCSLRGRRALHRTLQLERVTVVGHSFGCQVVAQFMRNRPERVVAVVLQAPSVDAAARTLHQQIRRIRVNSVRERATALEKISRRDYRRAGFARCWGPLRQSLEDAIEENVAAIDAPALVVCGGRDPVVPARWARRLADLLPQGKLLVIPDATHSVPLRNPKPSRPQSRASSLRTAWFR